MGHTPNYMKLPELPTRIEPRRTHPLAPAVTVLVTAVSLCGVMMVIGLIH